jgi:hypothetical protein
MCGLRDVLEVFRDVGASVSGRGRSLRAGICDLRDVSEVFSRSRCVGTFPTRDNVSFARRFGGVRRLPMRECGVCATFWGRSEDSCKSEDVSFARRFGGVSLKVQMC